MDDTGNMKLCRTWLNGAQHFVDFCIAELFRQKLDPTLSLMKARVRCSSAISEYYMQMRHTKQALWWLHRAMNSGVPTEDAFLYPQHLNAAMIFSDIGNHKSALFHGRTALAALGKKTSTDRDGEHQRNEALANCYVGNALDQLERYDEATPYFIASMDAMGYVCEQEECDAASDPLVAFVVDSFNLAKEREQERDELDRFYPLAADNIVEKRNKYFQEVESLLEEDRIRLLFRTLRKKIDPSQISAPTPRNVIKEQSKFFSLHDNTTRKETRKEMKERDEKNTNPTDRERKAWLDEIPPESPALRHLAETRAATHSFVSDIEHAHAEVLKDEGTVTRIMPVLFDEAYYRGILGVQPVVMVPGIKVKDPNMQVIEDCLRGTILQVESTLTQEKEERKSKTWSVSAFFAIGRLKLRCRLWRKAALASANARGQAYGFGNNECGQLGLGTQSRVSDPVLFPHLLKYFSAPRALGITKVACGATHVLAVVKGGGLYSWGDNEHGQCGHALETEFVTTPRHIESLRGERMSNIACGGSFSVALTAKGEVYAWGCNDHSQLGRGSPTQAPQPLPEKISTFEGFPIKSIACGDEHTACTDAAGNGFTWGRGDMGQLGNGEQKDESHPFWCHTLAHGATGVSCGADFTLFLTQRGEYFACGNDRQGQLGTGVLRGTGIGAIQFSMRVCFLPNFQEVRKIACGFYHTLILTSRGEVYTTGLGKSYQLGNGKSIERQSIPHVVEGIRTHKIVDIAAGTQHSMCLSEKGVLIVWGDGDNGQIGTSRKSIPSPHVLSYLRGTSIKQIACGYEFSIFLTGRPTTLEALCAQMDSMIVAKPVAKPSSDLDEPKVKTRIKASQNMFLSLQQWLQKSSDTSGNAFQDEETARYFESYLRRIDLGELLDFERSIATFETMEPVDRFFEARSIMTEYFDEESEVIHKLPITKEQRYAVKNEIVAGRAPKTLFKECGDTVREALQSVFPNFVRSEEGQQVPGLHRKAKLMGIV